jgi:hypothetical protein
MNPAETLGQSPLTIVASVRASSAPPLHAIDDCQFVVAGHVGRVESGDKSYETWAEGSHLKEYTYAKTGGTGKYEGLAGGGTYMYEGLTDKLFGGRYKGRLVLP